MKRNVPEEIRSELQQVQQQLKRYMRIGLTFVINEPCDGIAALKKQISCILEDKSFRFYAGEQVIAKFIPAETSKDDIFVHYSEALHDLRKCILGGEQEVVDDIVSKWISLIESHRYPVNAVRSWAVNLIAELELKYAVMQHFVTNFDAEMLHRAIYGIDTLAHLRDWIIRFLVQKREVVQSLRRQELRKEIAEAKRYVLLHLHEKIGMEEMAYRLNLNPSHFSRLFKKETGETFVEFVTRSKMARAQELLDKSDLHVDQIAEQLGFEHTSYFIKLFRTHTSMSPAEYRRRM